MLHAAMIRFIELNNEELAAAAQGGNVPAVRCCPVVEASIGLMHRADQKCITCHKDVCTKHAIRFDANDFGDTTRSDPLLVANAATTSPTQTNPPPLDKNVYQCGPCFSSDDNNDKHCVVCIWDSDTNTDAQHTCHNCGIAVCSKHTCESCDDDGNYDGDNVVCPYCDTTTPC